VLQETYKNDSLKLQTKIEEMWVEASLNVKREFMMYLIFVINNFIEFFKF